MTIRVFIIAGLARRGFSGNSASNFKRVDLLADLTLSIGLPSTIYQGLPHGRPPHIPVISNPGISVSGFFVAYGI